MKEDLAPARDDHVDLAYHRTYPDDARNDDSDDDDDDDGGVC